MGGGREAETWYDAVPRSWTDRIWNLNVGI